jgi:hypothetical protein
MSFFISLVNAQGPITPIDKTGCMIDGVPTLKCFEVIFQNILALSSGLVVLILFIMFVTGSIMYLTSGGDPEKVAKAKSTFLWSIIGIALFLGSYLILMVIQTLFLKDGISLFKFEIPAK